MGDCVICGEPAEFIMELARGELEVCGKCAVGLPGYVVEDAEDRAEREYFERHDPAARYEHLQALAGDVGDGPGWFEPGADAGPEEGEW